jgi:hypothetical protein
MQNHCVWQSLWWLRAAQVCRGQLRIVTPKIEQILAVDLDTLQRLAIDGGSACTCTQGMLARTLSSQVQACTSYASCREHLSNLLRTICKSRVWGRCHKFLLQQHLTMDVPDAMALMSFDLHAPRTCNRIA